MSSGRKQAMESMISGALVNSSSRRLDALASNPKAGFFGAAVLGEAGYAPYVEGQALAVGTRVMLPLRLVAENPANPRVFYPEQSLRELQESLVQQGQQTAVLVYPANEKGLYVLKSGHRRSRALRTLGRTEVKAEVVAPPGDFFQEYREARDINRQHREHTHFDDAVRFREFLESQRVADQKELAAHLGISEGQVARFLSLGKLPRELLELMSEKADVFGLSVAYAVYRYWSKKGGDTEDTLAVVSKIADGKLSARQLEREFPEIDGSVPRTAPRREQALSRAQLSGQGKGELKAFEGKLQLKLEGLPVATRDQLYVRILQAFRDEGIQVTAAGPLGMLEQTD